MVRVRFLQAREVQDDTGTRYEAGDVVKMDARSAQHWTSRGVAELVDLEAAPAVEVEGPPAPTAAEAEPEPGPPQQGVDLGVDLESMTKGELRALAVDRGQTLPALMSKADMIAELRGASE